MIQRERGAQPRTTNAEIEAMPDDPHQGVAKRILSQLRRLKDFSDEIAPRDDGDTPPFP